MLALLLVVVVTTTPTPIFKADGAARNRVGAPVHVPVAIQIAPTTGDGHGAALHREFAADGAHQVRSLQDAADLVAALLRRSSRDDDDDVVVTLLPGAHRVPPGGLHLASEHSPPSGSQRRVIWRAAEAGRTSVHGGVSITGWQAVKDDPSLPDGVLVAAVPAALAAKRLRHLCKDLDAACPGRSNPPFPDLLLGRST